MNRKNALAEVSVGAFFKYFNHPIYISVTHMSHIEIGNTKLSLPVCVEMANALEIQVDDLLRDAPRDKTVALYEIDALLASCSPEQIKVILEIMRSAKIGMDKYMN